MHTYKGYTLESYIGRCMSLRVANKPECTFKYKVKVWQSDKPNMCGTYL